MRKKGHLKKRFFVCLLFNIVWEFDSGGLKKNDNNIIKGIKKHNSIFKCIKLFLN